MNNESISIKTVAVAGLTFAAITIGLTLVIQAIGLETIKGAVEQAGPLAPLLYIVVRAAMFIAAPITSGPIQILAGTLFGFAPGTLFVLIAEVIGGSANFWIARKLGRPVVSKLAGKNGMERIDKLYHQVGESWMLVYARLFLFAFYDFVSYAAGLTPLKYRNYVLITFFVGILPTGAAVYVGQALGDGNPALVGLFAALGVLCIIPLVFYQRVRGWLGLNKSQEGASA